MSLDFKRRLVGLQERMVDLGLDLVVYGSCQNFQYLTGLLIEWRRGTDLGSGANNVFVPREGEPILQISPVGRTTSRPLTMSELKPYWCVRRP